jgi:hypothetical protein
MFAINVCHIYFNVHIKVGGSLYVYRRLVILCLVLRKNCFASKGSEHIYQYSISEMALSLSLMCNVGNTD